MKPRGSRSRAALSVGDGTLSGQVERVTGGTRGLGKESVRALAAAGASLAVLSDGLIVDRPNNQPAYNASKAAIRHLTLLLRDRQCSGQGRRPHAVPTQAIPSVIPDQGS